MTSNIAQFDAVRSQVIASITGSYTPLGTPFTHAMRILHFINDTNGTYMISFDGVTDNLPILADGFSLYDLTSDQDGNETFRYPKGTQVFIKYLVAPVVDAESSNVFYLASLFGKGE